MARALRVYEIGIIKAYQYCIITNTNMFDVGRFRMGEELYVESEYSETVQNLLISTMTSELIDKYRFDRQSIMMICDMLQDDLESSTFRNRALTPNMKVFVSLRFYGSGSFQRGDSRHIWIIATICLACNQRCIYSTGKKGWKLHYISERTETVSK